MSVLPANLDYSDKDFASIRTRLFALISSVFPTWTDQNVADFGTILLELFSWVGDVLGFYQDNNARESRLVTATQRKNILNLAKMLNYTAHGATAATAVETFTLATVPIGDVVIPKGTKISTANITAPIDFQLLADLTIPSGTSPPTATATIENSEYESDTFSSTGLPDQIFQLSFTPFLEDSAIVTATDGAYTEVDNFLDSGPSDKHFVVSINQNGVASILFGDGINGTIPSASIAVGYKTGGGASGQVEPNTIVSLAGSFTDNLGNTVSITATNAAKSDGGTDAETNNAIKANAPANLRATTRSVAKEDFEIHAEGVPGVARALMTTSNEDPAVQENSGILYVVPDGGGVAGPTLLSAVNTAVTVTYPSTLTFKVAVQTPAYLAVNVFLRIKKQAGISGATAALNLRKTLAAFFALLNSDGSENTQIDFGANLKDANGNAFPYLSLGKIFDACEETAGVYEVDGSPSGFTLNLAHADVLLQAKQFPQLGTVSIFDADANVFI